MKGTSHLTCGLMAGFGYAVLGMCLDNLTPPQAITVAVAAGVASLVPDIDMPNSKLGRKIKPISKTIHKLFGHRTLTHSILWLIPLIILSVKTIGTEYFCVVLGTTLGFVSHILSDVMTRGGVPLLWPYSRKRYHLTNINSGEHDFLITVITDVILIGAYFLGYKLSTGGFHVPV